LATTPFGAPSFSKSGLLAKGFSRKYPFSAAQKQNFLTAAIRRLTVDGDSPKLSSFR
jgi:hypothetical protein